MTEVVLNAYIVYALSSNLCNFVPTLENYLFGAVNLSRNADIDKHKYSGYDIGFDLGEIFLFPNGKLTQNLIISAAVISSSVHIVNKKKDNFVLSEGLRQVLEDTALTVEKSIQLILLLVEANFFYACIIMEQIVIYLLMVDKLLNSK